MVIKCKPRVRVELEKVYNQQAYQTDDQTPSRVVVDTDTPIIYVPSQGKLT